MLERSGLLVTPRTFPCTVSADVFRKSGKDFHVVRAGFVEPGGTGKHQSKNLFRMFDAKPQGNGRAHGNATDDRFSNSQVIEERGEVVRELFDRNLCLRPERARFTMGAAINRDQPDTARWREKVKDLIDVGAEAMLKDKRNARSG